ncbi:MAG: hypothetical protein ACFFC7_29520 [Candidatus Hermodarchaeota archaeon]
MHCVCQRFDATTERILVGGKRKKDKKTGKEAKTRGEREIIFGADPGKGL